jgi:hypothetical protein
MALCRAPSLERLQAWETRRCLMDIVMWKSPPYRMQWRRLPGLRMYMSHRMRPIFPSKFAGIALTVKLKNEENRDPDALQGMLAASDQGGPNSV